MIRAITSTHSGCNEGRGRKGKGKRGRKVEWERKKEG